MTALSLESKWSRGILIRIVLYCVWKLYFSHRTRVCTVVQNSATSVVFILSGGRSTFCAQSLRTIKSKRVVVVDKAEKNQEIVYFWPLLIGHVGATRRGSAGPLPDNEKHGLHSGGLWDVASALQPVWADVWAWGEDWRVAEESGLHLAQPLDDAGVAAQELRAI